MIRSRAIMTFFSRISAAKSPFRLQKLRKQTQRWRDGDKKEERLIRRTSQDKVGNAFGFHANIALIPVARWTGEGIDADEGKTMKMAKEEEGSQGSQ